MSDHDLVPLDIAERVATLRLNRPEARNPLSRALIERFAAQLDVLARRDDVGALVITGNGPGFCAGADLAELGTLAPAEARAVQDGCAAVFDRLAALPLPSLAAVHGFAVGGGFFLTLYCDYRLVAQGTKLGFPAAARQWIPPWALSRLAGWTGSRRAEQLLLTQSLFSPEAAQAWGLVDELVPGPELLSSAQARARQMAETPRPVVAEIREFFARLRGYEHSDLDRHSSAGFERRLGDAGAQAAMREFFARPG